MNTERREYFILQKCWFDGPNVRPPQDYLGLFRERSQAEEVASHSAQVHASQNQAVVRTILLPGGYAFSAAGDLFWIRSIWVEADVEQSYGPHFDLAFGAHALINRAVIGGTGNVNSRRGSEAQTGVVFVGPNSHANALSTLKNGVVSPNTQITWIEFAPLTNVLDGWAGDCIREQPPVETLKRRANGGNDTNGPAAVEVSKNVSANHFTEDRPNKRQCYFVEPDDGAMEM